MARTVRRNVRVLLRQRHAVRGPVIAGVLDPVSERPAQGVRTRQDFMLIAGNLITPCIQRGGALDVVAVALLVAMQISDVAGDQLTLGVVPWSRTDAIARVQTRRNAPLFLAKVGMPRVIEVEPTRGLSGVLINSVGAGDPAAIARARWVRRNKEGHRRGGCCWPRATARRSLE